MRHFTAFFKCEKIHPQIFAQLGTLSRLVHSSTWHIVLLNFWVNAGVSWVKDKEHSWKITEMLGVKFDSLSRIQTHHSFANPARRSCLPFFCTTSSSFCRKFELFFLSSSQLDLRAGNTENMNEIAKMCFSHPWDILSLYSLHWIQWEKTLAVVSRQVNGIQFDSSSMMNVSRLILNF